MGKDDYNPRQEVLESVKDIANAADIPSGLEGNISRIANKIKQMPPDQLIKEMREGTEFGRQAYAAAEFIYDFMRSDKQPEKILETFKSYF